MRKVSKRLIKLTWYLSAVFLVLLALTVTAVRVALPYAPEFRADLEQWVSQALGNPVRIRSLDAYWRGWGPELKLDNLDLLDEDGNKVVLGLKEARIRLDILKSIFAGQFRPGHITLTGVHLSVTRDAQGQIRVRGISPRESKASGDSKAALWLLTLAEVEITDGRLEWRDAGLGKRLLRFENLNLLMRSDGDRHQFNAALDLPKGMGSRLEVAADLFGNVFRPRDWRGQIFLKGENLNPTRWLEQDKDRISRIAMNQLDFELWSDWEFSRMTRVEGRVLANGLRINLPNAGALAGGQLKLTQAAGLFSMRKIDQGVKIQISDLNLVHAKKRWSSRELGLLLLESGDKKLRQLRLNLDRMKLKQLLALTRDGYRLPKGLDRAFANTQPDADLSTVRLALDLWGDKKISPQIRLQAVVSDLKSKPWKKIPGLNSLSGAVAVENNRVVVSVDSQNVTADFGKLFRAPLKLQAVRGDLQLLRDGQSWLVKGDDLSISNGDLETVSSLRMEFTPNRKPFLDLHSWYRNGNAANAAAYYPVAIMSPKVVAWLDKAIEKGRVKEGGFILRGPLNKFPFKKNEGRFQALFNVDKLLLGYSPGWPKIRDIGAEVNFDGLSLEVLSNKGRLYNTSIAGTSARIPYLGKTGQLLVESHVQGPVVDGLNYLKNSPLNKIFGELLPQIRATGKLALDLKLKMPLKKPRPRIVGNVRFLNSGLNFRQWQLPLKKIEGELRFSEREVSSSKLRATLVGSPVAVKLTTLANGSAGKGRFRLVMQGEKLDAAALLRHRKNRLAKLVSGKTAWQAALEFGAESKRNPRSKLQITSDLRGLALALPEPLGKGKKDTLEVGVTLASYAKHPSDLHLKVSDQIRGTFLLNRDSAGIERGQLVVGGGLAILPKESGLVVLGKLKALNLDHWQNTFKRGGGERVESTQLKRVDLRVGRFEIAGHGMNNARLKVKRASRLWLGNINSKEAKGQFSLPVDDSGNSPITLRMEFLKLQGFKKSTDKEEQKPKAKAKSGDPRQLRAVYLTADKIFLDGQDIGTLLVDTRKTEKGIRLERLTLQNPSATLRATGGWDVDSKIQGTRLQAIFEVQDFGKMLDTLGYPETVRRGSGRIRADLAWLGGPNQFELDRLDGRLRFDLADGSMLNVDPGTGRLLGLLSLYTLPRRFILDFSDFFGKGMAFDSLEGDIGIAEGRAQIKSMSLDGPAADIDIQGQTDLAKNVHDLKLEIVPHITGTLPLLGALTAGAGVGAVMLFMQKIFGKKIDKDAAIIYRIRGDWDKPEIKNITPKKTPGG